MAVGWDRKSRGSDWRSEKQLTKQWDGMLEPQNKLTFSGLPTSTQLSRNI
jgi:hypothetical protein